MALDPQTEQLRQLSERHGSPASEQVGRVFTIIKHNYLMGFKREDILKALHDRVIKGETLQQIYNSMPFFNEKNKRNARTISVMGVSTDRWALRFTEILMADRKDALDTIQYWEYVDQVALLAFFFAVRGVNRKSMMQLAWLVLVGMGVSEVRALTTKLSTVGTGIVLYTIAGNMLRVLLSKTTNTRETVVLFVFIAAIGSSLYIDPPQKSATYTTGVFTDHLGRLLGLVAGWCV